MKISLQYPKVGIICESKASQSTPLTNLQTIAKTKTNAGGFEMPVRSADIPPFHPDNLSNQIFRINPTRTIKPKKYMKMWTDGNGNVVKDVKPQ